MTLKNIKKRLLNRIDPNYASRFLARRAKRLDLVASQVADVFHLAGYSGKYPLKGKATLEIGSGWVLSHSIIFWLLGAKENIATDIYPLAKPESLKYAVKEAIPSMIRDVLAAFEDHHIIRERLDLLQHIEFNFKGLEKIGIYYESPVDLAKQTTNAHYDFVFSNSVLEHIPIKDIQPLLNNLSSNLNSGGEMIHRIHLEDHRNLVANPFKFFSEPNYSRVANDGNRIRPSEWMNYFRSIQGLDTSLLFNFKRFNVPLPENIDPEMRYTDELDLRTTNIGTRSIKA